MKYIKQFLIILAISFAGELCKYILPFPIPASIYGMAIMFTGLMTGLVKLEDVRHTGKFLIEIMPIMFIPAAVGVMKHYKILEGLYLQSALIILFTTIFVMALTGISVQLIIRRKKRSN